MQFTRTGSQASYLSLLVVLFLLFTLTSCELFENDRDQPVLNLTGVTAPFPCEDGLADGTFPCQGIDMFSHVPNDSLGGDRANDIWGWVDPITGRQYALVGLLDGTSIVDITRPDSVVVTAKLNEPTFLTSGARSSKKYPGPQLKHDDNESDEGKEDSPWRDVKVYKNYLLVVSDAQPHGLQMFDLNRLREINDAQTPAALQADALYREFGNAHNIAVNTETGFAYAVGTSGNTDTCGPNTSLHMIDLSDPLNPSRAGCYEDTNLGNVIRAGYVHDTQCVIYKGTDEDYAGKEICFNSSESNFSITDVNDKSAPATISFTSYPGNQYAHQGWLTEDHTYFLLNDELNETRTGSATTTHIFDVSDLDNPIHLGEFEHETFSIDHNLYVRRNLVFQSNYTSGLRVFETNNLEDGKLNLRAYFDTHPENDAVVFDGSWSNYPFFDNGIVVVSDISNGLFVLSDPR